MGKYPVAAVKTMATLAIRAESSLREYGYLQTFLPNPANRIADAIAQSAVGMAHNLGATAIFTRSLTPVSPPVWCQSIVPTAHSCGYTLGAGGSPPLHELGSQARFFTMAG